MDELSMIIVLINVAFFIFIAIGVFAYNNRGRHNLKPILLSSGIYIVALTLFYYDVRSLLQGHTYFLITFFTCVAVLLAVCLFIRSLTKLYHVSSMFNIYITLVYVLFFSFITAYFSSVGNYFLRAVFFYIGLIFPLVVGLVYQYRSKMAKMFNLISFQIYGIFVIIWN